MRPINFRDKATSVKVCRATETVIYKYAEYVCLSFIVHSDCVYIAHVHKGINELVGFYTIAS